MCVGDEYIVEPFNDGRRAAIATTARAWGERNFPDRSVRPMFSVVRRRPEGYRTDMIVVIRVK
jgi:hypothetical protein